MDDDSDEVEAVKEDACEDEDQKFLSKGGVLVHEFTPSCSNIGHSHWEKYNT